MTSLSNRFSRNLLVLTESHHVTLRTSTAPRSLPNGNSMHRTDDMLRLTTATRGGTLLGSSRSNTGKHISFVVNSKQGRFLTPVNIIQSIRWNLLFACSGQRLNCVLMFASTIISRACYEACGVSRDVNTSVLETP